MPLTLPGLFNFPVGVSSAIEQRNNRAITSNNEALSFVNLLNAFNRSLETNDALEFRRDFADTQGTSILDRFNSIATNTNNPNILSQSVNQQQTLAPLLALSAVQNPLFGQQQGLPTTATGALNQGLLGFQPIFDRQNNAQIQQLLNFSNQAPQAGALSAQYQASQLQAIENDRVRLAQEAQLAADKRSADLQKQLDRLQKKQSQAATTSANTASQQNSAVTNLPLTRGTGSD